MPAAIATTLTSETNNRQRELPRHPFLFHQATQLSLSIPVFKQHKSNVSFLRQKIIKIANHLSELKSETITKISQKHVIDAYIFYLNGLSELSAKKCNFSVGPRVATDRRWQIYGKVSNDVWYRPKENEQNLILFTMPVRIIVAQIDWQWRSNIGRIVFSVITVEKFSWRLYISHILDNCNQRAKCIYIYRGGVLITCTHCPHHSDAHIVADIKYHSARWLCNLKF